MLNKIIAAMTLLLMMVSQGEATVSVNETLGDYRISFESGDNASLILKGWDIQKDDASLKLNEMFDVAEFDFVVALGAVRDLDEGDAVSAVGVLVLNESVNTTNAEDKILKEVSSSYMRVYENVIDGHKGIYIKSGSNPDALEMSYGGMYWLNEADDGTATELVFIFVPKSQSTMMTLLNTVHVEKI